MVVAVVVSVKVTVPVGNVEPVKAGVTVAVKLTCWFTDDGLGVALVMAVVVDAVVTTSAAAVTPLPVLKFESPL
jgi:hypothetical protein